MEAEKNSRLVDYVAIYVLVQLVIAVRLRTGTAYPSSFSLSQSKPTRFSSTKKKNNFFFFELTRYRDRMSDGKGTNKKDELVVY